MIDPADELLDELLIVAGSLKDQDGNPTPAHLNWRHDFEMDRGDDLPIAFVTAGGEEAAPAENAGQILCDRRWAMSAAVEVFLKVPTAQQRAELSRLKSEFRQAFYKDSRILELVAQGSVPTVRIDFVLPDDAPHLCGLEIEVGLTFDR